MYKFKIVFGFVLLNFFSFSQNDLDAIRYSRNGVNGTSRFVAMGGAFGAVGADLSCGAYNPAGLALYRKGDISLSGALKFTNNSGNIYNGNTTTFAGEGAFNNFGFASAWPAANDKESRNIISFSSTQLQNFSNSSSFSGYTSSNSIAKDMLDIANRKNNTYALNSSYEGLGYNTYLLDSADGQFFSFIDLTKAVKQTRNVVTSGKVNDLNFSYAYAYKDQLYFGASIGIPKVAYTSTTQHYEADDKNTMQVGITSPTTYTTTYTGGLPAIYTDKLGFNNLLYTEYFKTTGSGVNLKLGGIARVSNSLRIGLYYHTRTFYTLTDEYYSAMSVAFDKDPKNPVTLKDPENGGTFQYRIITPSRFSFNSAYVIKKIAVIALDYEFVNYSNAQLSSDNIADFADANSYLKTNYKSGHNIRLGGELNIKPIMLRAGYAMQGSPFGNAFSGTFVRHTFSLGAGVRAANNMYADIALTKMLSTEDYSIFSVMAKLKYNTTLLCATIGLKF